MPKKKKHPQKHVDDHSKKRICFAVTSLTRNGVSRVLQILLERINREKYDVSVLLTMHRAHYWDLPDGIRLIEPVGSDLQSGFTGKIKAVKILNRTLKEEQFDLVIALGDYAAMYIALAMAGVKSRLIVSERNDPEREPDKRLYRRLRDHLYAKAELVVCQTFDAANYFTRHGSDACTVIPNPVRQDLPMWNAGKVKRIVNFCRIDKQKNLPLLLEAFQILFDVHPEYQLDLYGDGPEKPSLIHQVQEMHLHGSVMFHPFSDDVHKRIQDASMFVSSSDYEGISNSMLEALAMGMPVICTDCPVGGAALAIHDDETGILVPCGDAKALADAMIHLADHPEEAARLGKNAEMIRTTFHPDRIAVRWEKCIDELSTDWRR